MDQFYLENTALYQKLLKGFKPPPEPRPATKAVLESGSASADLVVSARIRPLLEEDTIAGFPRAIFSRSGQPATVDVHDLYNHPKGRPILKSFKYTVDRLFGSETTTEEIYQSLVVDLIPFAWNGGIGTLFAYGQTGSGKTFTVSRLEQLVADSLMDNTFEGERQILMSIIDLAGNSAFDLLSSRKPISILEDSFGITQWAGASEVPVRDRKEVMDLIERAASFRRTAPTLKNDASSRSHSICRIRIRATDDSADDSTDGLLYLVDLAGSEAARDRVVHGADRMREAREINMSLSVLKDCIRGKTELDALNKSGGGGSGGVKSKQQKKPHIPFRHSTLTKVLKHVFDPTSGRSCKTVVVACINPSLGDVAPSKNTLRYAEMLRVLVPATGRSQSNPKAPMTWTNMELRTWITKNSGNPPIESVLLAPTESGAQFLRLSAAELEGRCVRNPGLDPPQAKAVLSKLWQMHVDSQHDTAGDKTATSTESSGRSTPQLNSVTLPDSSRGTKGKLPSSRDLLSPTAAQVPFKQRIRPGMAVSWRHRPTPGCNAALPGSEESKLAVVLCLASTLQQEGVNKGHFKQEGGFTKDDDIDIGGNGVNTTTRGGGTDGNIDDGAGAGAGPCFLCALVTPGLTADAYELNLWQQVVLDVDVMEREVFLDYDPGARYYYISV